MAPTPKQYDMIVIGGGSGGSGTARRSSGWYGAKTCIIDAGLSGGCCVNVGCIPKKMTKNMASINEIVEAGKHYGYNFGGEVTFDFAKFVEKRHARIKQLNGAYETNWAKEGIELIHGTATFVNNHELEVKPNDGSESYRVTAPHITICTGSYPTKPQGIPGSEYGITSDDWFSIKHLPKKFAVVGGGYIAVEMTGIMNALDVETHLFIRHDTFLRKFDPMVQETMTKHYDEIGVNIHRGISIKEVIQLSPAKDETDPREKQLKLILSDGSEMVVNELLWAIGRGPEIRGLGLENTDVKQGEKGHLVVDKYQNTSVDGIYALGDITGQAELTPVAIAAGRMLGNRLFGPEEVRDSYLEYDKIPSVVFSHPPLGSCGLTEPEANEQYGKENVKIYQTKFIAMFYDMFPPEEKKKQPPTQFKLVCVGKEEKIVGMHLIGDGVDEMMQGFAIAVKLGCTKAQLSSIVAIHPTSSEEVVTLR